MEVPLDSRFVEVIFPDQSRHKIELAERLPSEKMKRNTAVAILRPVGAFMVWGGSFTAEWFVILPGLGLVAWAEEIRGIEYNIHFDYTNLNNTTVEPLK